MTIKEVIYHTEDLKKPTSRSLLQLPNTCWLLYHLQGDKNNHFSINFKLLKHLKVILEKKVVIIFWKDYDLCHTNKDRENIQHKHMCSFILNKWKYQP